MNTLLAFIRLLIVCLYNLLEIQCIGFVTSKSIVNGFNKPIEPKQGEFPHQATLLAQMNGTQLIFCGGSLIHPRWILTAAHCLEQDGKQFPTNMLKVSLGSVFFDLRGGITLNVTETYIYKAYNDSRGSHDIGLMKLRLAVKLSETIKVIKLHNNRSEDFLGQVAYLTGLGITNDFFHKPTRLRKAILHVNTPEKCRLDRQDSEGLICCTSTVFEGKACKGDSGGPLVIKRNGELYQIGVTSHLAILSLCKVTFNPSVYTKVAAYIDWISAITGIDFTK